METIKHYLREKKTKLFSEIVFHWHREQFFRVRIAINIRWSLGEPMYDIQNWWTFIKHFWRQNYFLKRLFLLNSLRKRWFNFILNTRKICCECFSESENHIWKQVSVSCFSPKTIAFENVNCSQNQIENVILHIRHLTKLTLNIKTNDKEARFRGAIKK